MFKPYSHTRNTLLWSCVLYSDCEHDYDKMTFNFFVDAHVNNYPIIIIGLGKLYNNYNNV